MNQISEKILSNTYPQSHAKLSEFDEDNVDEGIDEGNGKKLTLADYSTSGKNTTNLARAKSDKDIMSGLKSKYNFDKNDALYQIEECDDDKDNSQTDSVKNSFDEYVTLNGMEKGHNRKKSILKGSDSYGNISKDRKSSNQLMAFDSMNFDSKSDISLRKNSCTLADTIEPIKKKSSSKSINYIDEHTVESGKTPTYKNTGEFISPIKNVNTSPFGVGIDRKRSVNFSPDVTIENGGSMKKFFPKTLRKRTSSNDGFDEREKSFSPKKSNTLNLNPRNSNISEKDDNLSCISFEDSYAIKNKIIRREPLIPLRHSRLNLKDIKINEQQAPKTRMNTFYDTLYEEVSDYYTYIKNQS